MTSAPRASPQLPSTPHAALPCPARSMAKTRGDTSSLPSVCFKNFCIITYLPTYLPTYL
ncbi:hypothetical protein BKA81DRAFT_374442 [Phyllosticta paracitricarpa]